MVLRSSARKVARGKGRRKKKVKKTLFEDAALFAFVVDVDFNRRVLLQDRWRSPIYPSYKGRIARSTRTLDSVAVVTTIGIVTSGAVWAF